MIPSAREPDDFRQLLVGAIDSKEYVRRLEGRVKDRYCPVCGSSTWPLKGAGVRTCKRGHHT